VSRRGNHYFRIGNCHVRIEQYHLLSTDDDPDTNDHSPSSEIDGPVTNDHCGSTKIEQNCSFPNISIVYSHHTEDHCQSQAEVDNFILHFTKWFQYQVDFKVKDKHLTIVDTIDIRISNHSSDCT
jgi:hypothetical protein